MKSESPRAKRGAPFRLITRGIRAKPMRLIHMAYRQCGYRLAEVADHLGVHESTVSRRLKQAEQGDV